VPFILLISPLVFFMTVWVVVSIYRILRPEEPEIFVAPGTFDFLLSPTPERALVGAKSIRDSGRRVNRQRSLESPYEFFGGQSEGFPEEWWEDVVARQN
jgi:hypothetical protein